MVLLAVVVTLLTPSPIAAATASAGPHGPAAPRRAPLLDPGAPGGAWAGYSLGEPPARSRSLPATGGVTGMDVSGHQGNVDWPRAWGAGARFTYVKATEGTTYRSPVFDGQYHGSRAVGMFRGAYHFALPNVSSGAAQANFFVDSGGGWAPHSRTLPGALDIEANPYGPVCYGLDPSRMSHWITEFSDTYHARTGRFPVIYTTRNWWNRCTGGDESFAANNPLWVAHYGPEVGALPTGWGTHTFWQFTNHGILGGDQNTFNGTVDQLARLAG